MHFRLPSLRSAFIVLATVDALALSAQQSPGYSYDVVSRFRMSGSQYAPSTDTTPSVTHVVTTGKGWRMDQKSGRFAANSTMGGDYMVFDGKVVRSVSNATKTISVMGPEVITAAGQMMQALPASVTLTDVSVVTDSLGPSETMLGMPTSHWRVNMSVTFNIDLMGQVVTTAQHHVTDFWIGPPLAGALDPRSVDVGLDTTKNLGMFEELTRKQMQATRRVPKGVVLKSVTSMEMTSGAGPQNFSAKTEITTDVQNFQRTQVDAHFFDVPADYKVVNMADLMRDALDSARARMGPKKPPG